MNPDWTALRAGFETVVGIVVTPFTDEDDLDEAAFGRLVRRAASAGIRTLTPNGNTSEFYSLSSAERHRAVELTVQAAPEALVVPGVGGDLEAAVADARRYERAGAQAVMVHQPVHPFWSAAGWLAYHQRLSKAVPGLGVIPYLRSPRVGPAEVAELVGTCANVVAVKYAVPDPVAFATMVGAVATEQVAWVCGLAEMWAPFFAPAGAVGFTSGLVSVDPHRSLRMLACLQAGDQPGAMAEWAGIREFEELRARDASEMNVSAVKEALAHAGLCSRSVRPPLSPLGPDEREQVGRIVSGWNISEQEETYGAGG